MNNLRKLIYPYQTINKLTQNKQILPHVYRIGISDIAKDRIVFDYKVNPNFKYVQKKNKTRVKHDEILCHIYNLELDLSYVFYTPYSGQLVNINYNILDNISKIPENNEKENWLFDVKLEYPYKYSTYS